MTTRTTGRPALLLLLAEVTDPAKDTVAATLGWMCRERGVVFDAYYATGGEPLVRGGGKIHESHQSGALFSVYGSTLLGGRHHQVVADALATHETTVVRLGDVQVFGALARRGAAHLIESSGGVVELLRACAEHLGVALPRTVVAVQTAELPEALRHGVAQYVFPEAVYRRALSVPLELGDADLQLLRALGASDALTVAAAGRHAERWQAAGFTVAAADTLDEHDTYSALTFRVAERWAAQASGYDLCEPVLASFWLPFSIHERRLQVCGETMAETVDRLAPLVRQKGDSVVYGRYAGGLICGALDDEDLFGLFRNDIAFEVIEPGRPVLRAPSYREHTLPQPDATPFDFEPSDDILQSWAAKGKILVSLVYHSGELSHDDAIVNVLDISALTKVRVGIPMHVQRYTFSPDFVEPIHTPVEQGGVLGLCEPLLHSAGFGILAEGLATPLGVARHMERARDAIARVAGDRFVPRGVYCYLDALPTSWQHRPEALWQAIADAGFEYVLSSVGRQDRNQLLYHREGFAVLNLGCCNVYPYSPFIRVNSVDQMVQLERDLAKSGRPGWLFGVIDTPAFAYTSYLLRGESLFSLREQRYAGVRLGTFYDYIGSRGETHKLISATPRTIARYAHILARRGVLSGHGS